MKRCTGKKKKRDEVEERLRANATSVFPNVIIKVDFNTIFQMRKKFRKKKTSSELKF